MELQDQNLQHLKKENYYLLEENAELREILQSQPEKSIKSSSLHNQKKRDSFDESWNYRNTSYQSSIVHDYKSFQDNLIYGEHRNATTNFSKAYNFDLTRTT